MERGMDIVMDMQRRNRKRRDNEDCKKVLPKVHIYKCDDFLMNYKKVFYSYEQWQSWKT